MAAGAVIVLACVYDRPEPGEVAGISYEIPVPTVEGGRGVYEGATEEGFDAIKETDLCSVAAEAVEGAGTPYPGTELADGVGISCLRAVGV
jgi:hypothetical protein